MQVCALSDLIGVVPFREEDCDEVSCFAGPERERWRVRPCELWLDEERVILVSMVFIEGVREGGLGRVESPLPGNESIMVDMEGPVPDLAGALGNGMERCEELDAADPGAELSMAGGSRLLLNLVELGPTSGVSIAKSFALSGCSSFDSSCFVRSDSGEVDIGCSG